MSRMANNSLRDVIAAALFDGNGPKTWAHLPAAKQETFLPAADAVLAALASDEAVDAVVSAIYRRQGLIPWRLESMTRHRIEVILRSFMEAACTATGAAGGSDGR